MVYTHFRTVYLADTDAAGVVFFASGMQLCHEACEISLMEAGINLQQLLTTGRLALPIVHAEIDFFRPLYWGDKLQIHLTAALIKDSEFEVTYKVVNESTPDKISIQANTRHVCIDPQTRTRIKLSESITHWINKHNNNLI